MAGQDASSRATKIPCSRYLLNAKGYLQADRKPSAPRAARSRPPPVPCPKGCTRCCKASPSPGELSVFPEKRLTPGTDAFAQAALIATVCPCQLVVLPAQVTPSCSRLSAGSEFLKSPAIAAPLWSPQRCVDTAWSTCDKQAGHRVSLSTWAIWNIYSWHNRAA